MDLVDFTLGVSPNTLTEIYCSFCVIEEEENSCKGSLGMSVSLVICSEKLLELHQISARRMTVDVKKALGAFVWAG